ncbi:LCP family protein [Microcoleus sp. FACHB-831]|uniref:LCP family protein n=1 Tax=Microcoleus sp. FACHB-831 TaxID=2692827 RepID=UPI002814DDFE|nr:LCP family protein [Microcoleus sp. FACHB-831]
MPARKNPQTSPRRPKTANPAAKKPVKTHYGRWLWLWLGLSGVAMVSATAGALLAVSLASTPLLQHKLSAEDAAVFDSDSISRSSLRLPELTRPVNILVMGIKVIASDLDNPPPETKNLSYDPLVNSFEGLTDVMLLMRFNPETQKISVLSIPRDTRVVVDGRGAVKINEANISGGPAKTAKVVSELVEGVAIDRYVRVNVQGVEKLIDALGGVTVYVPKDMKYRDDTQHLYIDLKEGKQHLNGDQALQLLRFRHDKLGDIGRIQRQQLVMRALMEQSLNPTTLAKMPNILSVIQSHIDTNLSVEELLALVGFGVKTERSQTQMLVLPGDFNGDGHRDVSYWLPSRRGIQRLMAQYFDQGYSTRTPVNPARMRVAIQDSTGNPQAVKDLVKTLTGAGYQNVSVDSPWREPLKVTRIVAQQGDDDSAKAIYRALGFGEVRVESTGNVASDVTIQLGRDWAAKSAPNSGFISR